MQGSTRINHQLARPSTPSIPGKVVVPPNAWRLEPLYGNKPLRFYLIFSNNSEYMMSQKLPPSMRIWDTSNFLTIIIITRGKFLFRRPVVFSKSINPNIGRLGIFFWSASSFMVEGHLFCNFPLYNVIGGEAFQGCSSNYGGNVGTLALTCLFGIPYHSGRWIFERDLLLGDSSISCLLLMAYSTSRPSWSTLPWHLSIGCNCQCYGRFSCGSDSILIYPSEMSLWQG